MFRKKLDFLNDSWWPDYNEMIAAGIPVYRFIQKTGDIVWISGGCVHWVEAKGWTNNVAVSLRFTSTHVILVECWSSKPGSIQVEFTVNGVQSYTQIRVTDSNAILNMEHR